eukprot:TRINITY_DN1698_c0_g3_i1.p1 TRINITY_DN1698_c0_g3~~TRINITY_DN1698_c0_g3_i1.p1  ORF type:complete len:409 (+),score=66.29 TRINITY_DN1698_c0_g3_i1:173-1399(+)
MHRRGKCVRLLRRFYSSSTNELEKSIRESVRRLCDRFTGEYWRKLDKDRAYPSEFVHTLTESGFLSALVPEEYGGQGLSLREAVVILEEIHKSGCNAAACHAQMYTCGALLRHGTEHQKQKWMPALASGDLRLQAFGVTEPHSGTNTLNLSTRATRNSSGDYVLQGQKIWTSRAEYSDLMLVIARTKQKKDITKRTDGLSLFMLDMFEADGVSRKKGLTINKIDTMINHSTTEVFFDNVIVPKENLIGEENKGFSYLLDGLNAERVLIAAECLGDAGFFLERAVDYAKDRRVFGDTPIGAYQGVQFPLARAYAKTECARLAVADAIDKYCAGNHNIGKEANLAKLVASEASWEAGEACMQTLGGNAFAVEFDVERKWREARLYRIAPISDNSILCYLAEHTLGLPRSY